MTAKKLKISPHVSINPRLTIYGDGLTLFGHSGEELPGGQFFVPSHQSESDMSRSRQREVGGTVVAVRQRYTDTGAQTVT